MKITRTMIGGVACAAIMGVQGCAVSHDPYVNGMATGALATAAVSWLFYSSSDGYYYDHHYNRLPRNYRPPHTMEIRRIDSMDHYRRLHPRGPQLRTMHFHQRPLHYPERRLSIRNEPYPLQHRQPRPLHHPDHRVSVRNHPYPSQHRPSQPLIGNPPPHRHHPPRRASINPQAAQNPQDRRPDHRMQRPQQSPRFNHSGRQQWRPQFQR